MSTSKQATQVDVAQAAGVSTATVSRYFTDPERIQPDLRARVRKAVEDLGYTPHGAARALASRRTNTIGAIIPTLDSAIFATVVQTLQKRLASEGRTLLLAATNYDPEQERRQIESFVVRGVDGLLLTGEAREDEAYALLHRRGIRYANTYVHHTASPHTTIGFDNRRAMAGVVDLLHDLGHRRFGMVAGIADGNDRAAERIAGTRNALQAKGLNLSQDQIVEMPFKMASGREGLRRLLDLPNPPTAVICGNDILAVGVYLEAERLGLNVPGDLSITGFDDLELAREMPIGLTTVHSPLEEMGDAAARYLLEDSDPPEIPQHIELRTELVVRGSTGVAPSP